MIPTRWITLTISLTILAPMLAACFSQPTDTIGGQQALAIIWDDLKPHTSSKKRDNWEIGDARRVSGREVVADFANASSAYCPGPEPPENQPIKTSGQYWYILTRPHPATPIPALGTPSPTAPPNIPEPFVREAIYLVDAFSGEIVARKLNCVVY